MYSGAGAGAGAGGTKGAIATSVDGIGAGASVGSNVVVCGGGGVVVVRLIDVVVTLVDVGAEVVTALVVGVGTDVVRDFSDAGAGGLGARAPPVSMTPNATRLITTAVRRFGIRAQPICPRRSATMPMTSAIRPTRTKKVATISPEIAITKQYLRI